QQSQRPRSPRHDAAPLRDRPQTAEHEIPGPRRAAYGNCGRISKRNRRLAITPSCARLSYGLITRTRLRGRGVPGAGSFAGTLYFGSFERVTKASLSVSRISSPALSSRVRRNRRIASARGTGLSVTRFTFASGATPVLNHTFRPVKRS